MPGNTWRRSSTNARTRSPPNQMSDALARNTPGAHPTQAASCIPHGRRKFVEVHEAFPEQVTFVLAPPLCQDRCRPPLGSFV